MASQNKPTSSSGPSSNWSTDRLLTAAGVACGLAILLFWPARTSDVSVPTPRPEPPKPEPARPAGAIKETIVVDEQGISVRYQR